MDMLLVTKAQAAESMSISIRQLEGYIARGEIAVKRLGRKCVRIERGELERFVKDIRSQQDAQSVA